LVGGRTQWVGSGSDGVVTQLGSEAGAVGSCGIEAPGTDGAAGTDGADGTAGTPGAPGTLGTAGTPGTPGFGSDGTPGAAGSDGVEGVPPVPPPGRLGAPGVAGRLGAEGVPGVLGASGPCAVVHCVFEPPLPSTFAPTVVQTEWLLLVRTWGTTTPTEPTERAAAAIRARRRTGFTNNLLGSLGPQRQPGIPGFRGGFRPSSAPGLRVPGVKVLTVRCESSLTGRASSSRAE